MSHHQHLPTFYPRITRYQNDGLGRDLYISYNNAGFDKKAKIYCPTESNREPMKFSHSIGSPVYLKPISRYQCDGNGRDLYIFRANARNFGGSSGVDLPNILRTEGSVSQRSSSPGQSMKQKAAKAGANRKIVNGLISRVFYGNAKGISERKMSPKVRFGKKLCDLSASEGPRPYDLRKSQDLPRYNEEEFLKGVKTITNYGSGYNFFRAYY